MDKEQVVAALRRCADGHMLIVSDVDLLRTLAERIEHGNLKRWLDYESNPRVSLTIDWPDEGSGG